MLTPEQIAADEALIARATTDRIAELESAIGEYQFQIHELQVQNRNFSEAEISREAELSTCREALGKWQAEAKSHNARRIEAEGRAIVLQRYADELEPKAEEANRLRSAIKNAPCEDSCGSRGWSVPKYYPCNCWKSKALADPPCKPGEKKQC